MNAHQSMQPPKPQALKGFEHINRFWDRRQKIYVAKILPGEFYVTKNPELIATTLGSCVSACIWDDFTKIGGMNHFMLPLTEQESHAVTWGNTNSEATRYGNYAMEHMINEIMCNGGMRSRLKAKVIGGANVMSQMTDVGKKNAEFVLHYLNTEMIPIVSQDLLSTSPRKVLFDPISGHARMKKLRSLHNDTIINREEHYREEITEHSVEGDVELF